MHSYPNARLTQKGRLRLVTQHLEHGRSLSELAVENGISLHCAYRWLARYRSGGPVGLPWFRGQVDRSHAMPLKLTIDD